MVEMLKDERKVVRRGDKLIFTHYQEQEYDEKTRLNFLKAWKKEKAEKQKWLKEFEKHKKDAMDLAGRQLDLLRNQIIKDIENIDEGVDIWGNVLHCDDCAEDD